MKRNINTYITSIVVIMIIVIYIALYSLLRFVDTNNFFSIENLILFVITIFITLFVSNKISNKIALPIRKIESHMNNLINGKIDVKPLSVKNTVKDVENLYKTYLSSVDILKRYSFNIDSDKSKTEIILEHMADGVIGFSTSGDVIHMNKASMNLLEINSEYNNFEKIINKFKLLVRFEQVMYLPRYKCIEHRINMGENILKLVFVPFFNSSNIPMGILLITRNITESIRLDNMRKEFVSNVSHEFKTPLTSIKGYSETMMQSNLSDDKIFEFAKVINAEAVRMDKLVKDLLQLSRFDYRKNSLKKIEFSLNDLVELIGKKMQYNANQREHELVCNLDEKVKVCTDKDSVEQVIINIVSNSIKYTPDGGRIEIKVNKDNTKAYVHIIDNGVGISEKDLERIYERFYRVDKARSRKMGGTGLGLAIVKETLVAIGGEITIKSEVDVGTETIISLPLEVK